MLGIISMAGNALRSFGSIHPAIKWGVVAIVGLLAVEFIGKEAISFYVAMRTAQPQIEQAKAQAAVTKAQTLPVPTFKDLDDFKQAIKNAPDPAPDADAAK